ncbi:Cystinosin-like protein [Hibiscus syriacus]|uniref:Cystinosin-like protein n=1 Tax=Hibiscus syriacus TaxID=106335 RepID=A0A6A3A8L3_HIBSY|nr:Cystinosin-like protein [Hibiscus syriacus]
MIPVALNDVAFSIHAVLLTTIMLFQIVIYERGTQKVSKISIGIVSVVWLIAAICFFVALSSHSWLCSIQVFMKMINIFPRLDVILFHMFQIIGRIAAIRSMHHGFDYGKKVLELDLFLL